MRTYEFDLSRYGESGAEWREVSNFDDFLRGPFWRRHEPAPMRRPQPMFEVIRQMEVFDVSAEEALVSVRERKWNLHENGACLPELCEFCDEYDEGVCCDAD